MKIVIDIPEEIYNHTQEYEVGGFNQENDTKLFMAIKNGISLPKGHGRLIDADSMKTMKNIQSANFNAVELIRLWIDKQQTIIEADKEGEQK